MSLVGVDLALNRGGTVVVRGKAQVPRTSPQ